MSASQLQLDGFYKLAQTIQILKAAGIPVDVKALAEWVGLPMLTTDEQNKVVGDLYQYHFEFGVITVNEARARLGLPKIKGGDSPVKRPDQGGSNG